MTQDLAARYARHRYLHLPALLTPARAAGLATAAERNGEWRPYTGHHAMQDVSEAQRLFDDMAAAVQEIIRRPGEPAEVEHWVNRYGVGEAIFRHTDQAPGGPAAAAVLVVCLAAPPPANGGALVLAAEGSDGREEEITVLLGTGDGLLFDGARLEHWTTPLESTPELPTPRRLVAVGRYWIGC